jgi:hypothetical protein
MMEGEVGSSATPWEGTGGSWQGPPRLGVYVGV